MNQPEHKLPPYLKNLNPEQLEGAIHQKGPILILAGAGSGKTRVLTHRIAHLIKGCGVSPEQILAVTFTNKAAGEMKARLAKILGGDSDRLWASTFHSSGLRILRRHAKLAGYATDFVVYDTQDTKSLLKELMREMRIDSEQYSPAFFQKKIDHAKNNYIFPEDYGEHYLDGTNDREHQMIDEVYDRYQRQLLQSNAMDFGDLLVNTLRLFEENPDTLRLYQQHLEYLLVDEFQDTNKVQYMLVRHLAAPQNNLFVVGDDDQSIYAFRGATIQNILNFEKDFPGTKTVKLEQNYRSTAQILDSANNVIARNKKRKRKQLWTATAGGDLIQATAFHNENGEANYIARQIGLLVERGTPLNEIALLYRTNAQSRALEEALMKYQIPYRIYGGLKFYDRKEVKDILAYLRLLVNGSDNQAFLRIVNTPTRGIGPRAVQTVWLTAKERSISLLAAARELVDQSKHLAAFVHLIDELQATAEKIDLGDLIVDVIQKSNYGPKLEAMKDLTAQSRLDNLRELAGVAVMMTDSNRTPLDNLRAFLDRASLASSEELPVEEARDGVHIKEGKSPPPTVSLMTLHLAKGLEFPVVFLTGLEEGLLPHHKSVGDEFSISEERRLCYVGMTRAMQQLYLTRARNRSMFSARGSFGFSSSIREASRFTFDIPKSCLVDGGGQFFSDYEGFETDEHGDIDSDDNLINFGQETSRFARASGIVENPSVEKVNSTALFLNTADSLANPAVDRKKYQALPRAELSDLSEGTRVMHPTFGEGTVESITGITEKAGKKQVSKAKLLVRFDNTESPKKLFFRHAKLVVVK